MNTPNDGGPAFPGKMLTYPRGNGFIEEQPTPGMSLRDHFAGNLAPAIYQLFNQDGTAIQYSNWKEGVAIEAYRIADAMLAARNGKEGA